jgi:hypothetical protein
MRSARERSESRAFRERVKSAAGDFLQSEKQGAGMSDLDFNQ